MSLTFNAIHACDFIFRDERNQPGAAAAGVGRDLAVSFGEIDGDNWK